MTIIMNAVKVTCRNIQMGTKAYLFPRSLVLFGYDCIIEPHMQVKSSQCE